MRKTISWLGFFLLAVGANLKADDAVYDETAGLGGRVRIVKVTDANAINAELYGGSKYQIERKSLDDKITVVGTFSVHQSAPLLVNGVGTQGRPPEGTPPVPFKILAVRDDGDVVHVVYRDGSTIYADVESSTFAPSRLATDVNDDPSVEISGSWVAGDVTITLRPVTGHKRVFSLAGSAAAHRWNEEILPNVPDVRQKGPSTASAKTIPPTSQPAVKK